MEYTAYATKDDVSLFTGIEVNDLPNNIESLIQKASDLITNSIVVKIKEEHYTALRQATCAQVEYWLKVGEQSENEQQIQSYSAGSISVTFDPSQRQGKICTRARGYLNKVGLLYRGVMT